MKHIKLFEDYAGSKPTEQEVYDAADEYFESINPNIMDNTGYNTYGNFAKNSRNKPNFQTSGLVLNTITQKSKDEVYSELYAFLAKKEYAIDAYCPTISDSERKALDLIDIVNYKIPKYRDAEYGRAISIKCESGKTICFYFFPEFDKNWWTSTFLIGRFDPGESESMYWTDPGSGDELVIVFWNGEEIVHGEFELTGEYEYDIDNEDLTYGIEICECKSASDGNAYSAQAKRVTDDNTIEDIMSIDKN